MGKLWSSGVEHGCSLMWRPNHSAIGDPLRCWISVDFATSPSMCQEAMRECGLDNDQEESEPVLVLANG